MRLLLDNCLSPNHARGLQGLLGADGHTIVHLREKFGAATRDEVWLRELADEGNWAVLTEDHGIRRKKHEREKWLGGTLVVFFLARGWSGLNLLQKHERLIRIMGGVIENADGTKRGIGFIVRLNGTLVRA